MHTYFHEPRNTVGNRSLLLNPVAYLEKLMTSEVYTEWEVKVQGIWPRFLGGFGGMLLRNLSAIKFRQFWHVSKVENLVAWSFTKRYHIGI